MKKILSLFVVAFLLSLSVGALAAEKSVSDKPRLKFEDCDNGNKGFLTFEEAQTCFPKMKRKTFDAIDTNKDDKITKKELRAYRAARKQAREAKAGAM